MELGAYPRVLCEECVSACGSMGCESGRHKSVEVTETAGVAAGRDSKRGDVHKAEWHNINNLSIVLLSISTFELEMSAIRMGFA
jgi:hypothetical protein